MMKNFKRFGVILIIVSMLMGLPGVAFASSSGPQEIPGVKVYVDGSQFETSASFYRSNNTILVPMREFFQKLSANIKWDEKTKTILVTTDEKTIELVTDQKIINNQTYLPLELIAEALTYDVDWNPRDNIISITDISSISQMTMSKVYESSQFFTKDYVKMEITDNGAIEIQGRTDLDKTDWMFIVEKDNQIDMIKESHTVRSDHTYGHTFSLKNKLKEGKYKVGVYFKEKHDKMYRGYYWNIPLNYEDGEIFFPVSPVYTNNYLAVIRGSVSNPESYLEMSTTNAPEKKAIIDLANTITKDARSDYDKLLKVNDWVAQNIYYNWDGYLKKSYGRTDAYGTLISKKSVCQGYAELTQELLRAAGIPARLVTGHALGVSASGRGWDEVNHEKSNHAWNEAFVDDRWVILDTTWNSGNIYENGEFKKGSMNYKYFDIDLKIFSFSHKILAL